MKLGIILIWHDEIQSSLNLSCAYFVGYHSKFLHIISFIFTLFVPSHPFISFFCFHNTMMIKKHGSGARLLCLDSSPTTYHPTLYKLLTSVFQLLHFYHWNINISSTLLALKVKHKILRRLGHMVDTWGVLAAIITASKIIHIS